MSVNFRWEIAEFIGMDMKEEKTKPTNKQIKCCLSSGATHKTPRYGHKVITHNAPAQA